MTVINDIKPLGGCGSGGGSASTSDCATAVLGINCCSTAASSEISIEQSSSSTSSPSSSTTKVNNLGYNLYDSNFSHCKKVDIEFEKIKYTVSRFSFAEGKFGKLN